MIADINEKECDCKEKIILFEGYPPVGGIQAKARETWCPKHGYWTNCYMCTHEFNVQEARNLGICTRHAIRMKAKG